MAICMRHMNSVSSLLHAPTGMSSFHQRVPLILLSQLRTLFDRRVSCALSCCATRPPLHTLFMHASHVSACDDRTRDAPSSRCRHLGTGAGTIQETPLRPIPLMTRHQCRLHEWCTALPPATRYPMLRRHEACVCLCMCVCGRACVLPTAVARWFIPLAGSDCRRFS